MTLIKKIAAIMFAFMMVVSMSCNVKADDTTTATTEKGKITINNAIPGQTYTIYKILDLESYSPKVVDGKETGNFAYKPSSEWESFIKGGSVKDIYFTFDGEYVSWKENADPAAFAKLALDYAKQNSSTVKTSTTNTAPAANAGQTTSTVTFDKLSLGYYLVDSSVGTLCSLDTTKPTVEIKEKNGVPSVEKKVYNGTDYVDSNNANVGDTISFLTTINVKKGATNYILHDKMSEGLTYDKSANTTVHAYGLDGNMWADANQPKLNVDYEIKKDNLGDDCSFHIEFKNSYLEKHAAEEYVIHVAYNAILNENAVIAGEGNKNETWLKYGENNNLETTHPTTTTKTFEMNVFKFYKDKKNSDKETGLAGATFKLTKDSQDAENISFVKTSNETATDDVYRVAKTGETVTTITSPKSGKFTIQGLGAGTYYLTETKQPDGYNKLAKSVKVEIKDNGDIYVDNSTTANTGDVKVENKTGTVLPSTGGMGTTMIYLIGGALVLGSGVVLITKRRVKGK